MSKQAEHIEQGLSPIALQGKKAPFPNLDPVENSLLLMEQGAGALASVGIMVGISRKERVQRGLLLARALAARTHQFIRTDEPLAVDPEMLLFPESVHGNLVVEGWEWEGLTQTWGLFQAKPGISVDVPQGHSPQEYLWCTGELYQVLVDWGAKYRELAGTSAEPILVHYTGRRFGGPVMRRKDMSQIGLSAAVSLPPNGHAIEALWQTHPIYRIRLEHSGNDQFNVIQSVSNLPTMVLEPNPETERLMSRPLSVVDLLKQKPGLFDELSLEWYAVQLLNGLFHLSDANVLAILDAFKKNSVDARVLLRVAAERKVEGILLAKLGTQGKQLIAEVLLPVDSNGESKLIEELDEQLKVLIMFNSLQNILQNLPRELSLDEIDKVAEVAENLKELIDLLVNAPDIWELLRRFIGELDVMALIQGELAQNNENQVK